MRPALPVESLDAFRLPQAPMSGRSSLRGGGPRRRSQIPSRRFHGWAQDFFVADQGIGYVDGRLSGRIAAGSLIPRIFADSPLLHVDGRGESRAERSVRRRAALHFLNSSLDPVPAILRAGPGGVQPVHPEWFARRGRSSEAAARAHRERRDRRRDADDVRLRPEERRPGERRFQRRSIPHRAAEADRRDTKLELSGGADTARRVWNLSAKGGASLSILKLGFSRPSRPRDRRR